MTEGSYDDGNYLVRVRAQVMTRDDSTGGWLPMGGGGLSNVSVRKRLLSSSSSSNNSSAGIAPSSQYASLGVLANLSGKNNGSTRGNSVGGGTSYNPGGSDEDLDSNLKHEYLIYGKRISDSSVVLSCPIRKDFQYNKVMPTFHHWKTGDKKFGLTFQTAADARAFDKGVRRAVEDLLEGIGELSCFHDDTDIGDDDVFMTLELPVDSRSSSGSSSASGGGGSGVVVTAAALGRHPLNPLSMFPGSMMDPSGGGSVVPNQSASPYTHPHANHHHLHRMHFIRSSNTSGSNNNQGLVSLRNQYGAPTSDQWTNPAVLSGGVGESGVLSDSINQQFSTGKDIWVPYNKHAKTLPEDRVEMSGEPYSYVQFAKDKNAGPFGPRNVSGEHEYSYPVMDALKLGGGVGSGLTGGSGPQQHSSSLKKKNQLHQGNAASLTLAQQPPLLLPTKCKRKKDYFGRHGIQNLVAPGHRGSSGGGGGGGNGSSGSGGRAQCRHCLEMYDKDNNGRGSCEYAPDGVLACINAATCISCAQCMLYHCMSDAEGDFDQHPCSCNGSDDRCRRRWASMALLSLFVPCLWCYLPFKACHTCAVKCGCCGGKHQQSFSG